MRLLFEIDKKDYDENGNRYVRPSARGIIIRNNKIAMVHSLKFDYYKFPGGGIESGETNEEALIREVKEESGLIVIPGSIKEYGMVHRIQKGKIDDIFVQDNYYYLCEAEPEVKSQNLDAYEADEEFSLEFVEPQHAIDINRTAEHGSKALDQMFEFMINRESRVLELLIQDCYFNSLL